MRHNQDTSLYRRLRRIERKLDIILATISREEEIDTLIAKLHDAAVAMRKMSGQRHCN